LNHSMPLFLPLIERVWLREPIPRGNGRVLAIGMLGLVLILRPGSSLFQPAALVGVAAAVFSAMAQVGVRTLSQSEPVLRIVFYFGFFSSLATAGPALAGWATPPLSAAPVLLCMGVAATLAQLLMTAAYSAAPAARVGPFMYTSVVFAALLDWLLHGRVPDAWTCFGSVLVASAGMLSLRGRTPAPSPLPAYTAAQ
jgi:drug/metabolite transporter (DMT)-like permease